MKNKTFIFLTFLSIFFVSCASTIKVDFDRPAELNIIGSSISISSSNNYYGSSTESQCFEALSGYVTKSIVEGGYLTYIDSNGTKEADYYISWSGIHLSSKDYSRSYSYKDSKGYTHTSVTYYREVFFDFDCKVTDTKNNKVVAYKNFSYSPRDSSDESSDLLSSYKILSSSIKNAAFEVVKLIQPYTVTKKIKLLSHSDKAMKNANQMVKSGLIVEGGREYLRMYREDNYFEAGYNAALLFEALGKYDSAEILMEDVVSRSNDKKAYKVLQDIRNEKELNHQFQQQTNPSQKAEGIEVLSFDEFGSDFMNDELKENKDGDANLAKNERTIKAIKRKRFEKSTCNELILYGRLNSFNNPLENISFNIQYLPFVKYKKFYSFKIGAGLGFNDGYDLSLILKNGLNFNNITFDAGIAAILKNFNFEEAYGMKPGLDFIYKSVYEASAEIDWHFTDDFGANFVYIPAQFSINDTGVNTEFIHSLAIGLTFTAQYH
ncbi:MAG: hypothetical protein K5829_09850 [Treponema sp.]|nr:hypothetical protein [Treponema sp.]